MSTQHNTTQQVNFKQYLSKGLFFAASLMAMNTYSASINDLMPSDVDPNLLNLAKQHVELIDKSVIGKLDDSDDRVQRQLAQNHRDYAIKSYTEFLKLDKASIPLAPVNQSVKGGYVINLDAPDKAVYFPTTLGKTYINLVALQHNIKAALIEADANKRLAASGQSAIVAKSTTNPLTDMFIDSVTSNTRYFTYISNYYIIPVPRSPRPYTTNAQNPTLSGDTWVGIQTAETGNVQSGTVTICGVTATQSGASPMKNNSGVEIGTYRTLFANATCPAGNRAINVHAYGGLNYTGTHLFDSITVN